MPPITPPTIAPIGAAEDIEEALGWFEGELLADVVGEIVAVELVIAELLAKTCPTAGSSHEAGYSALHRCQFRLSEREQSITYFSA